MDYDELKKNLLNIEKSEEYKKIPTILGNEYTINSVSSAVAMTIRCDANLIGAQLVYYFNNICKNFQFNSFNDKKFIDNLKFLIKSEAEFKKFLDMIQMDIKDFFKILVYIAPTAFTSNLIKFIHKTYLNIDDLKK